MFIVTTNQGNEVKFTAKEYNSPEIRSYGKAAYKAIYDALLEAQPDAQTYNFKSVGRVDSNYVVEFVEPTWLEKGYVALRENKGENYPIIGTLEDSIFIA